MLTCTACHAPGIFEHSVISSIRAAREAKPGTALPCYSRCRVCAATFVRSPSGELGPSIEVADAFVWMRPPWLPPSAEADFECSWDLTEHGVDRLARDLAWMRSMAPLLAELRRRGWGPRLRAGMSVATVIMSRSREHGLRDDQSYVSVLPHPDGSFMVDVKLPGRTHRERMSAASIAWLDEQLEQLAAIEID